MIITSFTLPFWNWVRKSPDNSPGPGIELSSTEAALLKTEGCEASKVKHYFCMWNRGKSQTLKDSIGNLSPYVSLLLNVYAMKSSNTLVKVIVYLNCQLV